MPKFLEQKLKAEYGPTSDIPYKVMNAEELMRGNKTTAKGEALQRKHDAKKSGHPHKNLGKWLHPKKGR